MFLKKIISIVLIVSPYFIFSPVLCQETDLNKPAPRIAVTSHTGKFNDHDLSYKAIVEESFLTSLQKNTAVASIITTSYIAEGSQPGADRPVMFIFNGGPGASSSPLHMNAFGPRLLKRGNGKNVLIDNSNSLLDVADLVFIDPPGTGFTRIFNADSSKKYWDVKGDALCFIDCIKKWVYKNKRETSQLFLCGESYGTMRAAEMLGLDSNLHFAGVILFSSFLDMTAVADEPENDMQYQLYLPSMAAAAFLHNKIDKKEKSLEQIFEEAISFVQKEYAPLLFKGNELSETEKKIAAEKISKLIGISPGKIFEHNLRISSGQFQKMLLADEEKRIGQLDAQITGPLNAPGVKPPYDDPSMFRFPSNRTDVARYFTATLNFPDTGMYRTLNLDVNAKWNWNSIKEFPGYISVAPAIAKAMKEQKDLRLFIAGGYYDLATPVYAVRYAMSHTDAPANRIIYSFFPTGHSIFEYEEQLGKLIKQIRDFIRYDKQKKL